MFSAEQMYHLVNDVLRLPAILPGCVGSEVLEVGHLIPWWPEVMGQSGDPKSFTTRNQLLQGEKSDGAARWPLSPIIRGLAVYAAG